MDDCDSFGTRKARRRASDSSNPTVGVKSDFERLLSSFTETKTVRYEEFANIWRSMKMSLIFSGRKSDPEAREFTEDCFNIALAFLMPPYNFQVRVGALYILYGLYWKQPCIPKARIRVMVEQWKELITLIEQVKEQQHLDVEYVFTVLEYHRAFTFTATQVPMFPHMRDSIDDDAKLLKADEMAMLAEQKSILSQILEPNNIDQLSAIHEQYHRIKCLLTGTNESKPKSSLDVIKPSLVQYITKSVAAYEEKRKVITGRKGRKRHDSRDSGQTTTSESEPESDLDHPSASPSRKKKRQMIKKEITTGERRAQIKAKAFAFDGMVKRRGRKRKRSLSQSESSPGMSSVTNSTPRPVKKTKSPKSPAVAKKSQKSPKKSMEHLLEDATEICPDGDELRSSLLSMPTFDTEGETSKSKKKKVTAKQTTPRGKKPQQQKTPKKEPNTGRKVKKSPNTKKNLSVNESEDSGSLEPVFKTPTTKPANPKNKRSGGDKKVAEQIKVEKISEEKISGKEDTESNNSISNTSPPEIVELSTSGSVSGTGNNKGKRKSVTPKKKSREIQESINTDTAENSSPKSTPGSVGKRSNRKGMKT